MQAKIELKADVCVWPKERGKEEREREREKERKKEKESVCETERVNRE